MIEVEVNIRGFYGNKFMKESFSLKFNEGATIKDTFKEIDKKLKTKLFNKYMEQLPKNFIMLFNGDRIDSLGQYDTKLKDKDQLSFLSALGGG